MEKHALALIELYIELNRKQEELGNELGKSLGLSKGEVSPTFLDASIGKVESLVLDVIGIDEEAKARIWGNGLLYKMYINYDPSAEKILAALKKS